jgi:hypothetical protein
VIAPPLTTFRVHQPTIDGRNVVLSWTTTPRSRLYYRESAVIRFPRGVDPSAIPPAVWGLAATLIVHTHAAVLAPCRVLVPVDPGPNARGILQGHLARLRDTCEWYARVPFSDASITVEPADDAATITPSDMVPSDMVPSDMVPSDMGPRTKGAVALVSGGRDGFAQADLLREFCGPLVLSAVSSVMPPSTDHANRWRRRAIDAAPRLLDAELVEVRTDLRSATRVTWAIENRRAAVGMHEISDQVLFAVIGTLVACARGVSEVFLAAETEAHPAMKIDGRTILAHQPTSSVAVLAAVASWLAPTGIRLRSGIAALRSHQVSALLARRRPDLIEFVQTCWRVGPRDRSCSSCALCLARTLSFLVEGIPAAALGVDLGELGRWSSKWDPARRDDLRPSPRNAVAKLSADTIVQQCRQLVESMPASSDLSPADREWIAALSDRYPDVVSPDSGWCGDLAPAAGPTLAPALTEIANRWFGPPDQYRTLVGPSVTIANELTGIGLDRPANGTDRPTSPSGTPTWTLH